MHLLGRRGNLPVPPSPLPRSAVVDGRLRRLGTKVERAQRVRGTTPQRADELPVVVVRDLSRAVIELELFERRERLVSLLGEREPPLLELIRRRQTVVARAGLAEEGQCHGDDADDGEHGSDHECHCHMRIAEAS